MGAAKGGNFSNKNNFVGTNYNDVIGGTAAADTLAGGNGDDTIRGGAGNDTLWGDSFSNSDANDNGQDKLYGEAGNDLLHGGNGKDYLNGGADADSLYGGNGIDVLFGDSGADLLVGGQAGDFLRGGAAGDTFKFTTNNLSQVADSVYLLGDPGAVNWTNETTAWSKSWDVISDFSGASGEGDKIDLSQIVSFIGHSLTFRAPIGTDASAGSATPGLAYGVWSNAAGSFLYADITGDGAADMKIQVSGVGEGDFVGVTIDHDAPVGQVMMTDDDTDETGDSIVDGDDADGDDDLCDDDATALVTISFDEHVLNFDLDDLDADHGTLSNLQTSDGGKTWTATFTADQDFDGTGSVTVVAGGFTDYSANVGVAAGPATIAIDTENPTLTISIDDGGDGIDAAENADGTLVSFTFSEAVSGVFDPTKLHVTGGTLGPVTQSLSDPLVWTAVFTADAESTGTASITVDENGYEDDCGNDGETATLSFDYDTTTGGGGGGGGAVDPVVASVVFVTDPESNWAHNGASGVLGHFVAYDADGNMIADAFGAYAGNYGTGGKVVIAADGSVTIEDPASNDNFFVQLFDQYVHFQFGTGGPNTLNPDALPGGASGDAIEIAVGFGNGDTLDGDGLGDSFFGGNDGDSLSGLDGNDSLFGGAGGDTLSGGLGNDLLVGGTGKDSLSGGGGLDTFLFNIGDSGTTVSTRDVISDFVDADDEIDLSALGLTSFSLSSLAAFGAYSYTSGGNTYLSADTSGDGVADFSIMLTGMHALDATTNVIL